MKLGRIKIYKIHKSLALLYVKYILVLLLVFVGVFFINPSPRIIPPEISKYVSVVGLILTVLFIILAAVYIDRSRKTLDNRRIGQYKLTEDLYERLDKNLFKQHKDILITEGDMQVIVAFYQPDIYDNTEFYVENNYIYRGMLLESSPLLKPEVILGLYPFYKNNNLKELNFKKLSGPMQSIWKSFNNKEIYKTVLDSNIKMLELDGYKIQIVDRGEHINLQMREPKVTGMISRTDLENHLTLIYHVDNEPDSKYHEIFRSALQEFNNDKEKFQDYYSYLTLEYPEGVELNPEYIKFNDRVKNAYLSFIKNEI